MKKIFLCLSIIGILCFGLAGCDEQNEPTKESSKPSSSTSQSTNTKKEENKVTPSENSGEKSEPENIVIEDNKTEDNKKEEKQESSSEYTTIKFSDMYETKGSIKNVSTMLKNLNGKKVHIKGYPAVQSPLDESFVYLNNQPYVTCPFCTIGDITKLEVIPIFMANKSKIKYTENPIEVYGKLEVAAKVDSEGYTTQFRVYADRVEEIKDTNANKAVNEYYAALSQAGMIYDIQTLQMNIEYATNPEYMVYYDEKLQNGSSVVMDKVAIVKGIADEYIGYDKQYGSGYGSGFVYLDYVKECPDIVKQCEPADERLKGLNDELIQLYNDQVTILEKYQDVCYKIYEAKDSLTEKDADSFIKLLQAINAPNVKQYEAFTAWNNKLRE